MKPNRPQTIGIAVNTSKPEARQRLSELLRLLSQHGVRVLLDERGAALAGRRVTTQSLRQIGQTADLVIVLGGDGTLLHVVRDLGDTQALVLGVNLGGLGFLTSVRSDGMAVSVGEILRGKYRVSERQTLQATLRRNGRARALPVALNDFVVGRGAVSRVVRLQLTIDGELLTEYVCDGMIFATPTGSTAYSLSAGGPILMPATQAMIVTPICPHALSNRSIIVAGESVVQCRVTRAAGKLSLTTDGQVHTVLTVGDTVEVRRADRVVRLVMPRDQSQAGVLREKLKWSGANV
jgi:NAD+ kinase